MSDIRALPLGVHPMTLDEVHALFVEGAPHQREREPIWATFKSYIDLLGGMLPGTRIIIDGRFATWDECFAPRDIEFIAMIDFLRWARLPDDQRERLKHLRENDNQLDAHFLPDWDTEYAQLIITSLFERVRDHNGQRVPGERKGVIEVHL